MRPACLPIYIPTRGRVDKQSTWRELPAELRDRAEIVCAADEASLHKAYRDRNILVSPVEGIAKKLQWIVDQARARGENRIFIVHDDLTRLHRRIEVNNAALRIVSRESVETVELFLHVEALLDEYPMVGISQRSQQDALLNPVRESPGLKPSREIRPGLAINQRIFAFYGIDLGVLWREGIRFDEVTLMEDFHVNLSLLERGYDTALVTDFSYQQKTGSEGGCAIYRTPEVQKEAALLLESYHRPFVKALQKKRRSSWEGLEERWDVNCYWAAAASFGKKRRKQKSLI